VFIIIDENPIHRITLLHKIGQHSMVNLAWLLDVAANFDVEAGSNASASGVKRGRKRKSVSPVCLLQDSDCGMKKL